jgi:hypothetical protein
MDEQGWEDNASRLQCVLRTASILVPCKYSEPSDRIIMPFETNNTMGIPADFIGRKKDLTLIKAVRILSPSIVTSSPRLRYIEVLSYCLNHIKWNRLYLHRAWWHTVDARVQNPTKRIRITSEQTNSTRNSTCEMQKEMDAQPISSILVVGVVMHWYAPCTPSLRLLKHNRTSGWGLVVYRVNPNRIHPSFCISTGTSTSTNTSTSTRKIAHCGTFNWLVD